MTSVKGSIRKYAEICKAAKEIFRAQSVSTVTMTASMTISVRPVALPEFVNEEIQYTNIQPAMSEWKISTLEDAL